MKRINSSDVFGRKFKLHYGGRTSRIQTTLGGFLTILVIILISPVLFIYTKRVFDTKHPIVSSNTILSNRSTSYRLERDGNISIGFFTFNGSTFTPFQDSKRYFTMTAERYTLYKDHNNDNREMIDKFPIISCLNATQNLTNNLQTVKGAVGRSNLPRFDTSICGDMNLYTQWSIGGSPTELPYTKMVYRVYPCSKKDKAECISLTSLGQTKLVLTLKYKSMNFSDYRRPVIDGLDTDLSAVFSLNTHAKFTVWIKKNKIYDNTDSSSLNRGPKFTFFNVDRIYSTTGTRDLSTHCTEISIEDGLCMPYITFEVRLSNRENEIHRKYYRFFNLVSDVGGMLDLIFIVILAGYVFYRSKKYKEWIVTKYQEDLNFTKTAKNEQIQSSHKDKKEERDNSKSIFHLKDNNNQNNYEKSFSRINQHLDATGFINYSQKAYILGLVLLPLRCFGAFRAQVCYKLKKGSIRSRTNFTPINVTKNSRPSKRIHRIQHQIMNPASINLNNQIPTRAQKLEKAANMNKNKSILEKGNISPPKIISKGPNFNKNFKPSKFRKFLSKNPKTKFKGLLMSGGPGGGQSQPRFRRKILQMSRKAKK